MNRPMVILAVMWFIGAFVVHACSQCWLLLLLRLILAVLLLLTSLSKMTGPMLLLCASVFIISIGYNIWFDGRNVSHITTEFGHALLDSDITLSGPIATPVDLDGDHVS